ncbi:DNA repair protein RecN [Oligosphaera ethanolica]|uniref:DNA repair protein RecN n=1 Tax=Oligosphaera ethanolica TaxID=760260 RepID=A0AAE4AMT2_9BACT|nr:DNA repair protein RecN [Oligosphaera ethanolica]MDQ0288700.1 DNA repair protein RecN (Recombination protein N) [Oligosphaera ethanolica]
MLSSLHICNFALVQELDLEFGPGLNTITGETGAGKSLIIGAVQLLAGGRATPGSIRRGAKTCEVSGIIMLGGGDEQLRHQLEEHLQAAALPPCEDGELLIRRVLTENGSRAYVNGAAVTAGFLREIGEMLIDIHGPHDNQTLLQPSRQLSLLDTYAGLQQQVQHCRQLHEALLAIRREMAALRAEGMAPEDIELLAHQLKEIEQAELREDEEAELVERYRMATHAKRLLELVTQCRDGLAENDGSVVDQLGGFLRLLREIEQIDAARGEVFAADLGRISESIQELCVDLADYAGGLELDEEAFQQLEERLDLVQKLKRKYGGSLSEVLATAGRIRERLGRIRGRSDAIRKLQEREKEQQQAFLVACTELSAGRHAAATGLANAIEDKLQSLGFAKAAFAIQVSAAPVGASGADAVEYAFAPNVGEDMQPLKAIASSGEMARVMLAIKTVLSDADKVPILIFDEIDANVGGRVAIRVAAELAAVGSRHQVFSITHLAQIAAAGRQHYQVSKSVVADRTLVAVASLDDDGRLAEIVRMLGADSGSAAAQSHARELLQQAAQTSTSGKS